MTKAAREEGGEGASVGMGKHACQRDCKEDQVGVGSCAIGKGVCGRSKASGYGNGARDRKAWGTVTAYVTKAAREQGGDGASVRMGKHACQGDCPEDQVGVSSCAIRKGVCGRVKRFEYGNGARDRGGQGGRQ